VCPVDKGAEESGANIIDADVFECATVYSDRSSDSIDNNCLTNTIHDKTLNANFETHNRFPIEVHEIIQGMT
jgi:hypothetical protein